MAAQPENLFLLLILLPLAGLFWRAWRAERSDRRLIGDETLVGTLLHTSTTRTRYLRAGLQLAAIGLIAVALARPRWGAGEETVKRSGLQVLLLLDGSTSMAVQDIRPSRIEASKKLVIDLLERLEGNQLGMLMFGSTSYVQFPLTSDVAAARSLVAPIDTRSLTLGGTNIAAVIEDALRSFPLGQIEGRTIVLITDGEMTDSDGNPSDEKAQEAVAAAREAAKVGLTIHTVGMATTAGGPIPIYSDLGEPEFIKTSNGTRVQSKLNEPLLEQIASATGGTYFAGTSIDVATLIRVLEQSAPVDLADQTRRMQTERFYLFAGLALVLLVADVLLGRRKGMA
ncbi:MAG: VWA domain-containing protein [Herpetosiphonaceae bacterium]|nr:VWA domain-containing protein [Herpetosiphonaceae bacterium]